MEKKFDKNCEPEGSIGKNIYNIRKEKGITHKYLADQVGISDSYILLLEKNKKHPNVKILNKIANSLGVKLMELMQNQHGAAVKHNIEPKTPAINSVTEILKKMNTKEINTIHRITQKVYSMVRPSLKKRKQLREIILKKT